MVWLAIMTAAAGVVLCFWTMFRTGQPWILRILSGLSWLCAAALICTVLARACQLASSNWSGAKLAPALAMLKEYPLYQDPDAGAMTGWIYGPFGALVMVPAALGKTPTTCGLIGAFIALIFYFVPAAWLLFIASNRRWNSLAGTALIFFGWWTMVSPDLVDTSVIASPDSIVLGLSACACAILQLRRNHKTLFAAAAVAVLAVWTKQNYATLIAGLYLWILLEDGPGRANLFAGFVAAAALTTSIIFIPSFGASNMWFHMVTLPHSHPFNHADRGRLLMWLANLTDFFAPLTPAIALVLFALLLDKISLSAARNFRHWLVERRWPMFVIVALSLLPGGFLGMSKVGGGLNSLVGVHYFLLLAALCGAIVTCENFPDDTIDRKRQLAAALGVVSLAMATRGVFDPLNNQVNIWTRLAHPYQNGAEQLYHFAAAHPDAAYSPWNPLVTLLAERKLYHFEAGLFDRYSANRIPSTEQFTRHIPSNLQLIVYIDRPPSGLTVQIFTQFHNQVQIAELSNCIVLSR